jgi:hypothetical protein
MYSTHYSWPTVMKLEFSRQIFEKYSYINFHGNPCPVGVVLFVADRRKDMTKLTVAFRNFAKAPKNDLIFELRSTW